MKKRSSLYHIIILFIITLSIIACNPGEEIVPTFAPPDTTTVVQVPDDTLPDARQTQAPPFDSAKYRFATFKDLPYRILYPRNYDSTKTYPLMIFLHGIGERGADNEKQLTWGSALFQADSIREKYPSFVVFPQCKRSDYWFDNGEKQALKGMIDDLQQTLPIRKEEIYIGGLSMGAYGTYAMVSAYPGLFAAAVAISGDGDASRAPAMSTTRWRIFAGKNDHIVPSAKSEKMASALKKSGASVAFTLYANADHTASWVNAFAEPDFCSWIFSSGSKHGGDGNNH